MIVQLKNKKIFRRFFIEVKHHKRDFFYFLTSRKYGKIIIEGSRGFFLMDGRYRAGRNGSSSVFC